MPKAICIHPAVAEEIFTEAGILRPVKTAMARRSPKAWPSRGWFGQAVFDGVGLGEGLGSGLLVRFGFVGEVFGDEETGDLFLFGGEGFEVGDALELLEC